MITRLEIVSSQPDAPSLPLGGFMPNDDPVQIRNIDGLGPVKSDLALTPFATGKGELFQGAATGKRNIVLTLGLNPNWAEQTVSALRQLLYRYFMPELWSTLRFVSDEYPILSINGITESFEPNIFSQDPEIQISVICPRPDFIDLDTIVTEGVIGVDSDEIMLNYDGTVNAGFVLLVESTPELSTYSGGMTVANTFAGETKTLSLSSLTVDDTMYLEVNTVKTTRHIYNVRYTDGEEFNILGKMAINSKWPEFGPGLNMLAISTDTPGLKWKLGYFNRYGGL